MSIDEMVRGCINDDRKSQEALYLHFSKSMYGVCLGYTKNKEEAKDVLQDGFIKVFKNIKKYTGEGSIEGWIRTIIVNTAIDYYRKKIRSDSFVDIEQIPEEQYTVLEDMNAVEVFDLMQKLPEGAKIIFNLFVVEGYSHEEIAQKLDISESTSKSQVWRAKKLMQDMLGKIYGNKFYVESAK